MVPRGYCLKTEKRYLDNSVHRSAVYTRDHTHSGNSRVCSHTQRPLLDTRAGCQIHIHRFLKHYDDVIMSTMAPQITSRTIVYSIVYSDAHQRKHQSSASLAFVRGIHRGPVNSPHKWPVTRKMFPFDDVIMNVEAVRQTKRQREQMDRHDGRTDGHAERHSDKQSNGRAHRIDKYANRTKETRQKDRRE